MPEPYTYCLSAFPPRSPVIMSLLFASLPVVVIVTVRYGAELLAFCRQLFTQAVKLTRGTVSINKTHAFVFSNCTHGQVDSVLETFHLYDLTYPSLCIGQVKG